MALTEEDKNEILELAGKGYSYRKITGKTGHGEKTVGKVVKKARREVIDLVAQDFDAEKIAKQLGFPLNFVNSAIEKWKSKQTKEERTESVTDQKIEAPDLETEWGEFKKQQKFENGKSELHGKAKQLVGTYGIY